MYMYTLIYLQYFMQRYGMCGGSLMIALYCIIMAYMYMYVIKLPWYMYMYVTCTLPPTFYADLGMACMDLRVLATRK